MIVTNRSQRRPETGKGATGNPVTPCFNWSGRLDLNQRPPAPHAVQNEAIINVIKEICINRQWSQGAR